ncbi:hypothetical protein JHV675_54520 [Mycobacterium avium subsp. hominissuis]
MRDTAAGSHTAASSSTSVESARTQRRLHLPSEAARRYERGVDPAISVAALGR